MAEGDGEVAVVVPFKKRGAKGKAGLRKRPVTPPPVGDDSDGDSDSDGYDGDYGTSGDEAGLRVKRRKKNTGGVTASSRGLQAAAALVDISSRETVFSADRSVPISISNDATKQSNWYDEGATGAPASKAKTAAGGDEVDGTYLGLAHRPSFIQKNPNVPNRSIGPVKAPTNVRTITVIDFAPDVCKDYKQTGFCGFGDNCKFLHAREAYAQGWELDKEWEKVTQGKKALGGTIVASADRSGAGDSHNHKGDEDEDEDGELEKIPFACIICKGPYRSPVITRCGHYFCEPCALTRYRKDPTCAACGAGTNGVFNAAERLQKLLDRKRERAARRRQARREAGEEVSEEDTNSEEET